MLSGAEGFNYGHTINRKHQVALVLLTEAHGYGQTKKAAVETHAQQG